MASVTGSTPDPITPGVYGENTNDTNAAGPGVRGVSKAVGVVGESKTWHGIAGLSQSTTGGFGVYGKNTAGGTGVVGESETWMGVYGRSSSATGGAGVMGDGNPGPGVIGKSTKWIGVYGETAGVENGPAGVWGEHKGAGVGVKGVSKDGVGLAAYSTSNEAVHAETRSPNKAAIAAYNLNPSGTGAALFAKKEGSEGHAGFFVGNVYVTGTLAAAHMPALEALVTRVAALEQRIASSGVGGGTTGTSNAPNISVTYKGPASQAVFTVKGTGFLKSHPIAVRVVGGNLASVPLMTGSDATGTFSYDISLPTQPGQTLYFSANDGRPNAADITGVLWSNTVPITAT
jgi:hypothetical protein